MEMQQTQLLEAEEMNKEKVEQRLRKYNWRYQLPIYYSLS